MYTIIKNEDIDIARELLKRNKVSTVECENLSELFAVALTVKYLNKKYIKPEMSHTVKLAIMEELGEKVGRYIEDRAYNLIREIMSSSLHDMEVFEKQSSRGLTEVIDDNDELLVNDNRILLFKPRARS